MRVSAIRMPGGAAAVRPRVLAHRARAHASAVPTVRVSARSSAGAAQAVPVVAQVAAAGLDAVPAGAAAAVPASGADPVQAHALQAAELPVAAHVPQAAADVPRRTVRVSRTRRSRAASSR